MKNIILGLVLISTAAMSSAFACSPEAQFIGNVTKVAADCSFEIEFSAYNESVVCPLSIDEALATRFENKSCSFTNGDFVSGYLIVKEEKIVIE